MSRKIPKKLPKGWAQTTLGEITAPSRERAMPSDEPGLPYVGLEHVESQTMKLLGHGDTAHLKSSSVRFHQGDVLYGKMRPYLNKVWLAEFNGLCSAEFLVLPCVEGLNSRLLAYRLNSQDFVNFANHRVSGDRPRVDFEKLATCPYPLAPKNEQERIVEKLDTMLAKLSTSESAARRALDRLKCYRAAVLYAAVTGQLTRAWRKTNKPDETGAQLLKRLLQERRARWEEAELKRLQAAGKPPKDDKWKNRYPEPTKLDTVDLPNVPRNWSWATLDQLAQEGRPIIYGIIKPGPHDPNGVPYVRVMEMKDGNIDVSALKRASPARAAKFARATLAAGDVLISKDGTIGRVAVVPPELAGGNITQHVMRAPIHQFIWRDFVVAAIRSDWCQHWLTGETRGVALQGVNVEDFRRLPIPIPPFPEQRKIEKEVERRLTEADRLATTLDLQLARAAALRQSLLREAFTGNLVPQNANDEPASVLLQRIRDAKITEAKQPKPKRMLKQKKPANTGRLDLLEVLREHGEPMTPDDLFKRAGYAEPLEPAEVSDPIKAVEAFFAEVSRLTRESVLVEKRSAYDRGLVQLEVKK